MLTDDELISKFLLLGKESGYLTPTGARVRIRYAKRSNGRREAESLLLELKKKGEVRILVKFLNHFLQLAIEGRISSPEDFKQLEESQGIWEFREHKGNYRLYCYFDQDRREISLTHGCRKPKGHAAERAEINKAALIRDEDQAKDQSDEHER